MYFYELVSTRKSGFIPKNIDATAKYLLHYRNSLLLKLLSEQPRDFEDRADIEKEMQVCERKMQYWRQRENFDQERAIEEICRIKKQF